VEAADGVEPTAGATAAFSGAGRVILEAVGACAVPGSGAIHHPSLFASLRCRAQEGCVSGSISGGVDAVASRLVVVTTLWRLLDSFCHDRFAGEGREAADGEACDNAEPAALRFWSRLSTCTTNHRSPHAWHKRNNTRQRQTRRRKERPYTGPRERSSTFFRLSATMSLNERIWNAPGLVPTAGAPAPGGMQGTVALCCWFGEV